MRLVCSLMITLSLITFTAVPPEQFATSGLILNQVSAAVQPYTYPTTVTLNGNGLPVDAVGAAVFAVNGKVYQHPALQAQLALLLLNTYRIKHDARFLARASLNAQRLIDDKVVFADAWFYPYDFDFAIYDDAPLTLHGRWYSALAQGQALSTFVRLAQITRDNRWRVAAEQTFASFLIAPSEQDPWVTWVEADNHVWLEEYPRWPTDTSERVINGQIFAAFGLWDYYQLTHDTNAGLLFDGAVTTVGQEFTSWRVPGEPHLYSLLHARSNARYHAIVVAEYRCLGRLTGRHLEFSIAWQLYNDFPTARRLLCGSQP